MATMEITPSMMISIANDIKGKLEEWNACVQQIYTLHTELDAMWEGAANDAFNALFAEDKQKFTKLYQMMNEYQAAIITMANDYKRADEEAKQTVSKR